MTPGPKGRLLKSSAPLETQPTPRVALELASPGLRNFDGNTWPDAAFQSSSEIQ
jgi:hypothetical protein